MPALRAEVRARPVAALAAALAAASLLGLAVWAMVESRGWLVGMAAAAALVSAAAWLRARPGYGRRRGLPPGSLSLRDSLRVLAERDAYAREAARHGPIFKTAQFHRPVACLVGLEAGRRLLAERAADLARPPSALSAEVERGFLRYMSPADHARYAPAFRAAFGGAVLAAAGELAAQEARTALAALASRGDGGTDPRPVVEDYAATVLLRVLFGELLEPGDREVIDGCERDAARLTLASRPTRRARLAVRTFESLVAERARANGARAGSSVWAELARALPDPAGDRTVLGNLFLLYLASKESISGLVVWMTAMLAAHPDWLDRADGKEGSEEVMTAIVLETLRLAQSEYVYRQVVRPVEAGDYRIPAGWLVRICVGESHRLDPPFADPSRFDPGRHLGRRLSRDEYSPFGLDERGCMGADLTLALARAFARELARGYRVSLVAAGKPERGNRHWHHWRAGRGLRVRLVAAPARSAAH